MNIKLLNTLKENDVIISRIKLGEDTVTELVRFLGFKDGVYNFESLMRKDEDEEEWFLGTGLFAFSKQYLEKNTNISYEKIQKSSILKDINGDEIVLDDLLLCSNNKKLFYRGIEDGVHVFDTYEGNKSYFTDSMIKDTKLSFISI